MICTSCEGTATLRGDRGIQLRCPACAGSGKAKLDVPVIRIVLTTYLPHSRMFAGKALAPNGEQLAVRADSSEDGVKRRLGIGDFQPHLAYERVFPEGYRLEYDRTLAASVVQSALAAGGPR